MTLDEMFAAIMLRVRAVQPLYGCIYSNLPKKEVTDGSCNTMGVSSKGIVYNAKFMQDRTLAELIFINLHEITHFALLHPFRLQGRRPDIYNIACDLYVNALLLEELNLKLGQTTVVNKVEITAPSDALYSDVIDTKNHSVEIIYDMILKDMEESLKGLVLDKEGSTDNENGLRISENSGDNGNQDEVQLPSWVRGKVFKDLVYVKNNEMQKDIDKAKSIITESVTKAKLSNAGVGNGAILREVEKALCEKVPWEKLVSKYLMDEVQKETSYRTTDYRMNWQEAIFPGNKSYDKSKLDKVKICIDTSGSISDRELGEFQCAILQLLKKYKIGAELIYWDGACESSGIIKDEHSFKRVEIKGGGGTTPECLFKYFDSKKCKIKPVLSIILTDGYIIRNGIEKYKRKYKDTIWLISKRGDKNFTAPFGKVSHLR